MSITFGKPRFVEEGKCSWFKR